MFGDEFGVRTGRNCLRFAARTHLKRFPFRSASPRILDLQLKIDMFDVVFHRQREIRLAVKSARHERDGAFGHEFAHKNHAAPPRVRRFFANVKPQIHFFKITMQRNGQTEQARIEEKKADDADEGLSIFVIDLGAGRDERRNDSGSTT